MSEQSLESILAGEAQQEAQAPEVTEQVQEPVEEAQPQGEAATGEQSTPPVEQKQTEESWTKEMALDERRKRQELESELKAMRQQMEALKNPQQEAKRPDLFEDPEGALNARDTAIMQQVAQRFTDMSVALAKQQYPDYDEKEQVFVQLVQNDPTGQLLAQLRQSGNPALFAYQMGEKALKFQQMQDVESYETALREKIRKELEAEQAQKAQARDAKGKFIGQSLATARAAAPNTIDVEQSLEQLARLG